MSLARAKVAFDDGVARRLLERLTDSHPRHGNAIDFLANHDAECPEDEEITSMPTIGWVGDVVFWIDRATRTIFRWTIVDDEAAVAASLFDQEAEDRLGGGAIED